jgi:cell division protein FtsW
MVGYSQRGSFARQRDALAGWNTPEKTELKRKHKPDYILALLALFLVVTGLVVIYAISPGIAISKQTSESSIVLKQFLSAGLGLVAFFAVSHVPTTWWKKAEKPLIIASIITVIVVKLFGETINGAQKWIQIDGLSFQTTELVKLTLLIWIINFIVARINHDELSNRDKSLKPLIYALGAIGLVIAGLESDLGSAGVMVAMVAGVAYTAGMPMRRLVIVGAAICLLLILAIVSSPYRRSRVETFLNPEKDCRAKGYQICESLKAIGSGGMFGKGLGRSVQAYGYLPEASNDSIFAIVAEKFGFVGCATLLGVFGLLFQRIKRIAELTADSYDRLLVIGVLVWFSFQTIVNIGAMMGLLPLKGITLPFISTGGTSLFFVCCALGIVFQISRYTAFRPIDSEVVETNNPEAPSRPRPTILRRNV